MKRYESLVRNVGIGKEALYKQWVENTQYQTTQNDVTYTKDGICTNKCKYETIFLFKDEYIPSYVAFDKCPFLSQSTGYIPQKLNKNYEIQLIPKVVGKLRLSGWSFKNINITFNFDKRIAPESHGMCWDNACILELDDNLYNNTVINLTGDDALIRMDDRDMKRISKNFKTDAKYLLLNNSAHALNNSAVYDMRDEMIDVLVRKALPLECFPKLQKIYSFTGTFYISRSGWKFSPHNTRDSFKLSDFLQKMRKNR